jgi:hypothetical protein
MPSRQGQNVRLFWTLARPIAWTRHNLAPGMKEQGIERLVLTGSGEARKSQPSQEGLEFLFGSEEFELWVLEKGAVAAEPVGIGFLGF